MADFKPLSDGTFQILKGAANFSRKYYQTYCSTPHIFLALFSFLSKNKENPRYEDTYNNLKTILNNYNIDGKSFETAFLNNCPKGEEPETGNDFTIKTDTEYNKISEALTRGAMKLVRSMEVEDLILELFRDDAFMIFDIFTDITGSAQKTQDMYNEITKKFKKAVAAEIKELEDLDELTNLNKWVKDHPQTTIDADTAISKIEMGLSGRSVRNVVLTGKAGTGKTQYVYEFVQRINSGDVPEDFSDKIVYELNQAALVAGTRFRGDMEERLQNILNAVKENPNVILFIDELHSFLGLGAGSEDAGGCGQLIKPYLSRGEVQIIGATTSEEYTKFILKDKAFTRRLSEVKIEEPNKDVLRKILEGLLPVETAYFKKEIQAELVERVLELSDRYSLDLANPAKAINMLELACAYSKVFEEKSQIVDVNSVLNSVRLKYNIFISDNKLVDTKNDLFKTILGEDEAMNEICKALTVVDYNLVDPNKPLFNMLLVGPSGSGKTEAAKIIAKNYFGSPNNLVRIDCGGYSDPTAMNKLLGSSAGYVGYDDEPELIKGLREHPSSVLLIDEFDKAHRSVQEVFLNALDEGYIVDNKGNQVSLRNTIVIFTSNFGCTKDTGKATGMGFVKVDGNKDNAELRKAIENKLSKAFLSRLNTVIYYKPLSKDIIDQLIDRYLAKYNEFSKLGIKLSKEDREFIYNNADIETEGARNIEQSVRLKMAEIILNKDNKKKKKVNN